MASRSWHVKANPSKVCSVHWPTMRGDIQNLLCEVGSDKRDETRED